MDTNIRIAVVGATGAVGQVMLELLAARGYSSGQIVAMASSRSSGRKLPYRGGDLAVVEATPEAFQGIQVAFVSATDEVSRGLVPFIALQGCVAIDDSGVWRMEPGVPLVVPEVNADDMKGHAGILAIPNCSTTPMVMTLWPLHQVNPVQRIVVATYQSVSGTGAAAMRELKQQTEELFDSRPLTIEQYPYQIAYNLIPQIGSLREGDYFSEEWKMRVETRKIMHVPEMQITATCVRVPVFVCHSEAIYAEFEYPITPQGARELLSVFPGIRVVDDPSQQHYPMPIDAAGKDEVFVGRIRQGDSGPNSLAMWVVSDNLRKGAALNALQIMEGLVARKLLLA